LCAASLAIVAAPAVSAPAKAQPGGQAGPGSRASIRPHRGKPFVPALGDWEGTVNGFPASFDLRYDGSRSGQKYGFDDVVALSPDVCPVTGTRYEVDVIASLRQTRLGGAGSLGLDGFGFGGGFTGAKTASLSKAYHLGSCSGRLTWRMHPSRRQPVQDGTWKLSFTDGESSQFQVVGRGRLATPITLPDELARCNQVSGEVATFIAANGAAKVSQPNVRLSMTFSRRSATGRLNGGGHGCPGGPFRLNAKLLQSST
jgi:hypothetical protein